MARKCARKTRKSGKSINYEEVIGYLKEENVFLRDELKKMTDLCAKLANVDTATNAKSPPMEHATPININADTPSRIYNEATFTLPRRTAKLRTPPKNTWEPSLPLCNSFGALSEENASAERCENLVEEGVPPNHCDKNVTMRKRSDVRSDMPRVQAPNKRPDVTITEKYLTNFVPFVPGRNSYASATNNGKDVLIVGSSMLQRIRKREFSENMVNSQARFKLFPGATVNRINYYLVPELREQKYSKVVVHSGTNDLYNKTAGEIVDGFTDIFNTCREHGVEQVIFSSIVIRKCRRDIDEKRLLVNSLLKGLCELEWVGNGNFVDNDNIYLSDLYTDGLHLVESGSIKLANNILNYVNRMNN